MDYVIYGDTQSESEYSGESETDSDSDSDSSSEETSSSDESEHADLLPETQNLQPQLKSQSQTLDRFSSLPNNILLKIFSNFTVHQSIQLGLLSKRFQHLWKSLSTLRFRDQFRRGNEKYFVDFVNQTLILYNYESHKVKELFIEFHYEDRFETSVNRWIWFATRRNVEEIVLAFSLRFFEPDNRDCHEFGEFFYTNHNLKKLVTSFCNFSPQGTINWSSLRYLSICFTTSMDDEIFEEILLGYPVLESLIISKWTHLSYLDINSRSLKSFALCEEWLKGYEDVPVSDLVISAPFLQSLQVSDKLSKNELRLSNLGSLVEARIDVQLLTISEAEYEAEFEHEDDYCLTIGRRKDMLMKILDELCNVKELTLGDWCLEVLSTFDNETLPSALSKCKSLLLDARFNKKVIDGMSILINASPQVEKLTLYISKGCSLADWDNSSSLTRDNYTVLWRKFFQHLLPTLKVIEIEGFCPKDESTEQVTALIKFLLSNATILEKMVIDASGEGVSYLHSMPRESLELAQKFLCLPRASPHALVQFT